MNLFFKRSVPGLALLGLVLGGCQPELEAPSATAGSADFTRYIAVGNSLTAGYADGGLYNEGQANSYPAILAQQFAKTEKGPAAFIQPSFGAGKEDGSGYIKLLTVNGSLTPVQPNAANNFLGERLAVTGNALPGGAQLEAYSGPQPDNLGIPGISVLSSVSALTGGLAPYGAINPFYERLLTAPEKPTKDYVTYIGQKNTSTFFTCWLGNNDVLGYATEGGVSSPANPFSGLTDTTRFGIGYRALLGTLTRGGTVKGVVANIPNVTNVPYFTTVPVAAVIAGIKANPQIPNASAASLYITTGTGTVREATATDLLVLPARAVIGSASTTPGNPLPVGVGYSAMQANPLPSRFVLDAAEVSAVVARTNQLNNIIAKTARQNKVPLADMNAFFQAVAPGIATNGVNNNATFVSGNLFSLDGVHPTPRGYAIIANEFIRVINTNYGASVPTVNANNYRGVQFPL